MNVTVAQTDIAWEDIEKNLSELSLHAQVAADANSDLLLLPEMFACGFSMDAARLALSCKDRVPAHMQDIAARFGVWIGGSYPEWHENQAPSNCFLICAPDGTQYRYRKLHPFSYATEDKHYSAGTERITVDIAGCRCTPFICYDLRFANAFWSIAPDTDAFLVIANWPITRRDAWRKLLLARAIENQSFVIAANRIGDGGGLEYSGDSMIVDPMGQELSHVVGTSAYLHAKIDPKVVAHTRHILPFMADRRNDL